MSEAQPLPDRGDLSASAGTFLGRIAGRVKKWWDDNLFAILSTTVGAWTLFSVPQVFNLWAQFPTKSLWYLRLLNLVFLLLVVWFYVPSWRAVIFGPPHWSRANSRFRWLAFIWAPAELASKWLPAILKRFRPAAVRVALVGCLGAVALLIHLLGSDAHGSRAYPLAGSFCRASGLLILLVALWLAFGSRESHRGDVWQACGRALSWLISSSLIGELIWLCASYGWIEATFRVYTVWFVVHLFSSLIVSSSLVDFWNCRTQWPVRFLAAIALLVIIWAQHPQRIHDMPPQVTRGTAKKPLAPADRPTWFSHAKARLKQMPEGPVVIVAASGGGSRAAIFTSLVLEELSRSPMIFRADSDDDTASVAAPSDVPPTTWSQNIFLISSVSGGSLATADYIMRGAARDPRELRNIDKNELLDLVEKHVSPDEHRSANVTAQMRTDATEGRSFAQEIVDDLRSSLTAKPSTIPPVDARQPRQPKADYGWLLTSAFVDDMATDFMAPILRGAFTPGTTRSDSLAHFWDQQFDWKFAEQSDWDYLPAEMDGAVPAETAGGIRDSIPSESAGDKTNKSEKALPPLVIFNTCDIDRGARLAIGFPRIPAGLLKRSEQLDAEDGSQSAHELGLGDPATFADLAVSDLSSLSLARAVRLSSNFPWGFPIAQLDEHSVPALQTRVRMLDGGVVDNTGIDTLYYLFVGLNALAVKKDSPADPRTKDAKDILHELRRRKVILVEIDSGARPTAAKNDGPFTGVVKPLDALNNALYSNAQESKKFYLSDVIRRLPIDLDTDVVAESKQSAPSNSAAAADNGIGTFKAGLESALPPLVFHHTFSCDDFANDHAEVMTAWALGPDDEAVVVAQFLANLSKWRDFNKELPGELKGLNDCLTAACAALDHARVHASANAHGWTRSMTKIDEASRRLATATQSPVRGNSFSTELKHFEQTYRAHSNSIDGMIAHGAKLPNAQGQIDKLRKYKSNVEQHITTYATKPEESGKIAGHISNALPAAAPQSEPSLAATAQAALDSGDDFFRQANAAAARVKDFQHRFDQRTKNVARFYERNRNAF